MIKIEHESKGLVSHGVSACAGCGMELVMRSVMNAVGEDTVLIIPPGCAALFSGSGKETAVKVAGYQCNLENVAATASGVRAALTAKGNFHTTVLGFAGDGGTVDIGLQSLSGAMERNENILYICYDNEAYMNTGVQASSSSPKYAYTTTTPAGKPVNRKDLIGVAIAHGVPYAATASVCNLRDLQNKVKKAKETEGFSLVHVHAPCPTGWRYDPAKTIEVARAAVETGCWILYEYENKEIKLSNPRKELKPLDGYLKLQGRFKHLTDGQREEMQREIAAFYDSFIEKAAQG